jgi:hypothetical protein
VSGQDDGSELHFRTGISGRLARFFVARRAAGDPLDATIVLPCLIFLSLVRLNDLGRVDVRFVIAGLVIPACIAGCWIGVCLGNRGVGRAMLRSILVGAFEGAALVGLVKETVSQSEAFRNTVSLILLDFTCFWFFAMLAAAPRDIFIQTENEWQETAPRRALVHKIIRITLGAEDLKGVSTGIAATVWAIKRVGPFLLLAWTAWQFVGINPWVFFKSHVASG